MRRKNEVPKEAGGERARKERQRHRATARKEPSQAQEKNILWELRGQRQIREMFPKRPESAHTSYTVVFRCSMEMLT